MKDSMRLDRSMPVPDGRPSPRLRRRSPSAAAVAGIV